MPPKIAEWLLSKVIRTTNKLSVLGDLEEEYQDIADTNGIKKAQVWYWKHCIRSIPPFIIFNIYWKVIMLFHYFKLTYRSLFKNRLLGIISISSLSIAIGAAIAIFVIIDIAYNFNNFHENAEQIFQVQTVINRDGNREIWGSSPMPLGPKIKSELPQVKRAVRIADYSGVMIYNDKIFHEELRFVDKEFLELFTFPLRLGDKTALARNNAIILSQDIAVKYFGEKNPIGKQVTIKYQNGKSSSFLIQGVAEKFPLTAGFAFNVLLPYENIWDARSISPDNWAEKTRATFIQLNYPYEISKIKSQMERYIKLQNEADFDWPIQEFQFTSLLNIANNSHNIRESLSIGANPGSIIIFSLIGLFLLLLAFFNYVNISITSASRRLKEIGIRKVLGSNKIEIAKQFFSENILLCSIALFFGSIFAQVVCLPVFYKFTDLPYIESIFVSENIWIFLPVLLVFIAICSGIYPAFYISAFQPVNIFRGKQIITRKKPFTRLLVVSQFAITFLLITFSIVITQNAEYQKKIDWGYNQEQVIVVPISERKHFKIFRNKLNKNPHIINIAGAKHHIGKSFGTDIVEFLGKKYEVKKFEVGEYYLETMNIRLQLGRSFNPDLISDEDRSVIINEEFVNNLNLSDPVGTYIRIQNLDFLIIGVVENFHYHNFMTEIEPALLRLMPDDNYNFILARVEKGTALQTAEIFAEIWKKLIPDEPYDAFYQDQVFELFFRGEDNISILFSFFALIALIIACMGLFGLASVTITNRMKEIGVRKVLGASVLSLLKLINKQFLILIAISTMIATPISYLMIKSVIESVHQYHIPISYSHFTISFILILFTSVLTISSLIYRATSLDPVITLKYE